MTPGECGEIAKVDDPGAPTRVEIELTPTDGSRTWRRRSDASTTVELSGNDYTNDTSVPVPDLEPQVAGEVDRPHLTERRKLVVGGAVVAVVALFVGWALGRSGGAPAGEAQTSPSTTEASALETLAPAAVPSTVPATTRPVVRAGPTTTTAPEWEAMRVEVDPAAAALDIRLVVVGGGRIVELDTGSGEMRALTTGMRFTQPPLVNAGEDWMLIRNLDSGRSQLVRDGELPVGVDIGDGWSTHFQRDTGFFWRMSPMFMGAEPADVVEIDHEGNATGRAFQVPAGAWPVAGDPAGGVVVGAPGGTYQVGPDGARRLTTGNLIALSTRIAVVTDCGDDFSNCAVFVLDRATGQRTELDLGSSESGDPLGVFNLQSAAFWGSPELLGAVSPDDRWAPTMITSSRQEFGLLDLTTGEFVPVSPNPPSSLWWSPDGRTAIYDQNSRLMLFDTEQRTWTDVLPASVSVDAFAVRP
jgi:hypothetical protein